MKNKTELQKKIVKEGISYSKKQIKKLEIEIKKMKKNENSSNKKKINDIIKWDKKLISDFKNEIIKLKKRL